MYSIGKLFRYFFYVDDVQTNILNYEIKNERRQEAKSKQANPTTAATMFALRSATRPLARHAIKQGELDVYILVNF